MGAPYSPPRLPTLSSLQNNMADVLSSSTWKESVQGEIKARKAWKAKYGHQFEMEDSLAPTPAGSRPATSRSVKSQSQSRPATGMSQCSTLSQKDAQRQKLIDLKAKLTAALGEVEEELAATQSVKR